jgi:hypothetical protein
MPTNSQQQDSKEQERLDGFILGVVGILERSGNMKDALESCRKLYSESGLVEAAKAEALKPLADIIRNCPEAEFGFNDDQDAELPMGFYLHIPAGCAEADFDVNAPTLHELAAEIDRQTRADLGKQLLSSFDKEVRR